jgi:hypothetical protein
MRSSIALALFTSLLAACGAPRAFGPHIRHTTSILAGARAIDHDHADGLPAYGLELSSEDDRGWGYELVGTYAAEEAGGPRDRDLEFDELGLGVRRTFRGDESSRLTTLVGAGAVFTRVENTLHDPRSDFDDEGGAGYAHAAVMWNVAPFDLEHGTEALIGLDLRGLIGDDYDYLQLALVLGFGR